METWHDRLDLAMKMRGKKWADLVKVVGLSKPSVYAWRPNAKKRTEMMNGDNAAVVCAWLEINSEWLFKGTEPSGLDDTHPEKFMGWAEVDPTKGLAGSRIIGAAQSASSKNILQQPNIRFSRSPQVEEIHSLVNSIDDAGKMDEATITAITALLKFIDSHNN